MWNGNAVIKHNEYWTLNNLDENKNKMRRFSFYTKIRKRCTKLAITKLKKKENRDDKIRLNFTSGKTYENHKCSTYTKNYQKKKRNEICEIGKKTKQ